MLYLILPFFSDFIFSFHFPSSSPLMLKTQSLCTGAKTNLKDRVLGEVEKNNFLVCQTKRGQGRLPPLKTMSLQSREIR